MKQSRKKNWPRESSTIGKFTDWRTQNYVCFFFHSLAMHSSHVTSTHLNGEIAKLDLIRETKRVTEQLQFPLSTISTLYLIDELQSFNNCNSLCIFGTHAYRNFYFIACIIYLRLSREASSQIHFETKRYIARCTRRKTSYKNVYRDWMLNPSNSARCVHEIS